MSKVNTFFDEKYTGKPVYLLRFVMLLLQKISSY